MINLKKMKEREASLSLAFGSLDEILQEGIANNEPRYRGRRTNIYVLDSGTTGFGELLVKVANGAPQHTFIEAEVPTLKDLRAKLDKTNNRLIAHFPEPIDSRIIHVGGRRRANIFKHESGFYSMAQVKERYPNGLNPRDLAWMMNRLIAALAAAHSVGHIHTAVTPDHVLVKPENHNAHLINWCWADKIRPFAEEDGFIAPEVLDHRQPQETSDTYSWGCLGLHMLQKSDEDGADRMRAFFRSCAIRTLHMRPGGAWNTFDEFRDLLQKLYGKRTFRPFDMS